MSRDAQNPAVVRVLAPPGDILKGQHVTKANFGIDNMDIEEYLGTACNSTPSIENLYFRVGRPHESGTFVFVTNLPGSRFSRGIRHFGKLSVNRSAAYPTIGPFCQN